jgi:hypothetical protein
MTDKELIPEQEEHAVIAGALFDFVGWLTSRKERIVLSSTDDASLAVDAIKQFAEMRGLSLDNANVQGWVRGCTANLRQPEKTNQCAETCERANLCAVCGVGLSPQPDIPPYAWVTFTPYGDEDDVWYENPEGQLLEGWTYKPLYDTTPPQPVLCDGCGIALTK